MRFGLGKVQQDSISYGDSHKAWSQIELLLTQVMSEQSRRNHQDKEFGYPLAAANYGVEEVMGALESMASFKTTMWNKTTKFEDQFAQRFDFSQSVMVNSGSSADLLIAFALRDERFGGLEPGSEVLAPSVTWPTQIWSLLMAGFTVKLVDVDPRTLNISIEDLERKIGPATRALSLVHLMGNTTDLDQVEALCKKYKLLVLEDSCEALGTKWKGRHVGNQGVASSSSFFFSHHITTMEGGMVSTQSEELAEHLRLLRAHGWTRNLRKAQKSYPGLDPRYSFESWGFNVRPTELSSAFGLVQLERFDEFSLARTAAANYCLERIAKHEGVLNPMYLTQGVECSWFAFPIMVSRNATFRKDAITEYLEHRGVETRPIVAGNLARHPAVANVPNLITGPLAGADQVHEMGFYIGLHSVGFSHELESVWDFVDEFVSLHS